MQVPRRQSQSKEYAATHQYVFQLITHANIRYQESLNKLSEAELDCLLRSAGIETPVERMNVGGFPFLSIRTEAPLTEAQLWRIAHHSALMLLCEMQDGLLRPLFSGYTRYLSRDFSELLKYKGKTSAVFTRMMMNCAWAVSDTGSVLPTVLDPLCGKGTTCFVALEDGWNSVGIDLDRRDLKEALDHLERCLQQHRLKHELTQSAATCPGQNVPAATVSLANDRERYRDGDVRTVTLYQGDTALSAALMKKKPADLLIADLPYGIQHAPQAGARPESFTALLQRALPAWRQALRRGGAMALSFNTLTLPRRRVAALAEEAGFALVYGADDERFVHFVEQAVVRDVLLARRDRD